MWELAQCRVVAGLLILGCSCGIQAVRLHVERVGGSYQGGAQSELPSNSGMSGYGCYSAWR